MSGPIIYQAGDVIIEEGSAGEEAFYLKSGKVEVRKKSEDGFIVLSEFCNGDIFGEMSVVDESPRSASVIAVEETHLIPIHRDKLINTLQSDKKVAVKFLKRIFERLRDANLKLAMHDQSEECLDIQNEAQVSTEADAVLQIEALTKEAAKALPVNPFQVNSFPVTIGRQSDDPFVENTISIIDRQPYQVSRSHLRISLHEGKLSFEDKGSQLGLIVNGQGVGMANGHPQPSANHEEADVILGNPKSPYQFRFTIEFTS